MPEWLTDLFKQLPFKKLSRHDVTNLVFDLVALTYTFEFAKRTQNELLATGTWLIVIILTLVCVLWASKQ